MRDASGLSDRIAAHTAGFAADALPESSLHAAKRALLDGLGVMLAASGTSEEIAPFVDLARSGVGSAAVLGCGFRTSAAMAAFANGAMSHALDFEDAFDAAPSHPNASLLPAVLAVAQEVPVSGRDLLAAIAVGCDLVCRMGLSLRREMEAGGWYPPPILGAFGATVAAGRLRGLDAGQMRDAFSLTLCQAVMPGEIKYSRDTVIRAVREAFPAQAAVQATALAAADVRGFEEPFEGKAGFYRLYADGQFDTADLLDGLGERFWIEQLTFKRWPACRGTHAYIEAVQAIRASQPFELDAITSITATGGPVQRMLVEPAERKVAPTTAIDAKFSIPFTIAAALADDEVTLDSFDPAALADPRKLGLAQKVRFGQRADWGREHAASGVLEIALADGRRLVETIDVAAGHFTRPIDDAGLTDKFRACARRTRVPMGEAAIEQLAEAVWTLEGAGNAADALWPN